MSRLYVVKGKQRGETFQLQDQVILGRNYSKGIPIRDKTVSVKHAMIIKHDDFFTLYDLGSTNKTHINDKPVNSHLLSHGDRIALGDTILTFIDESQEKKQESVKLKQSQSLVSFVGNESLSTQIIGSYSDIPDALLGETANLEKEDIDRLRQRFTFLCHISNTIGVELSLETILKEAMGSLAKFFAELERGVIFLKDPETGKLTPAISVNFTSGEDEEEVVEVSSSILSEAIKKKISLISSNAMLDNRFDGASIIFQKIKFVMCSPLFAQDELLGAIYLDSQVGAVGQASQVSQDDLALLAGVASQIAIAIKNARLHQSLLATEKLKQELTIARDLQQRFLPREFPQVESLQFAAKTEPARHVGGDLYDIIALGDNKIGILIGDVSGKGVGAALYMASLISKFRFLARSEDSPCKIFNRLNKELVGLGTRGMFVTLSYMIIDSTTGKVSYVNGGHHSPILLKGKTCSYPFQDIGGPPLGIMEHIEYSPSHHTFASGDTIIFYTDGILEAKNSSKEEYGIKRLQSVLSGSTIIMSPQATKPAMIYSDGFTPEIIIDYVFQHVKFFCGTELHHDDLTMITTKFK